MTLGCVSDERQRQQRTKRVGGVFTALCLSLLAQTLTFALSRSRSLKMLRASSSPILVVPLLTSLSQTPFLPNRSCSGTLCLTAVPTSLPKNLVLGQLAVR